MSEWYETRLGEVLTITHGYAFKGEHFDVGGPVRLVTPGNFVETGGFRDRGSAQKSYSGPVSDGYVLTAGEIVIAMTEQAPGLLGSSGVVPAAGTWLHNQRVGRVRLCDGSMNTRFFYYLFNAPSVRAQINASATGTKVRHTAPERIHSIRALLPDARTQRRIATALTMFDDLIDINERRIEILDALVKSLYREWFVCFRFPGHERRGSTDEQVRAIPRGWSQRRLGDIATFHYGKALPARARRSGPYSVVSSAGVVGKHDKALVAAPGIVVGRKGNAGSVWWVDQDFYPIDTTYWVETDVPLGLLYWQLRDLAFIDSHAAVPGLSREQAYGLPVLAVDQATANQFGVIHEACFDAIATLRVQNRQLGSTRDLLLPRLVTGRLDISDIDLGDLLEPEAA